MHARYFEAPFQRGEQGIAFIQFIHNRMYVKHILTHAEYDKLCNRYARGDLK